MHFFYGADGSPAIVEFNGVSYGYVKNLQGDIIAIVNASGAAVVQYAYDAWGKPISKTGSMASTLGTLNPFRYRGYVYDEETGLYYLRSRYYNPTWSRFINTDTMIQTDHSLFGANLFAYCFNNPVNALDPSGFASRKIFDFDDNEDIDSPYDEPGGGGGRPNTFAGHPAVYGTSVTTNYVHKAAPHTPNQKALVNLAKAAEDVGKITLSDAEIMMEWCEEYNVQFHLDFWHPSRGGYIDQIWHVHIGSVNHLPIYPVIWAE